MLPMTVTWERQPLPQVEFYLPTSLLIVSSNPVGVTEKSKCCKSGAKAANNKTPVNDRTATPGRVEKLFRNEGVLYCRIIWDFS